MGNDVDFLDDSGVPMDGVELDSSSNPSSRNNSLGVSSNLTGHQRQHQQQQLASSVSAANSSSEAKASVRISSNNEAMASDSPALSYCDESKFSGNNSPDFASGLMGNCQPANNHQAMDELFPNYERNQSSSNNQVQVNQQTGTIRSFGDLFDDDDLD